MNTSRAFAPVVGLGIAVSASAAPTFIMSVGDHLYVRDAGGVTQQFSLSDNLTSMTVTPSGEVIATSPSDDANGLFEIYRIDNPTTAPTLAPLGDFLSTNTTSLTYVGNTLYGLQQQPGDSTRLVTIDIGATTETPVGQTGIFSLASAASGYDASSDTFYVLGTGAMGPFYELDYDVTAPADPTVAFIGQDPSQGYLNQGGEFFDGKMYALVQTTVGPGLIDVFLGEIDTASGAFSLIEQILDDQDASAFKDGRPSIGLAVIPAPGAATLLGLGAVVLARRRR